MTIAEMLGRIGVAFERSFNLVMNGAFGDLLLSDLGIIAATGLAGLVTLIFLLALYVLASD